MTPEHAIRFEAALDAVLAHHCPECGGGLRPKYASPSGYWACPICRSAWTATDHRQSPSPGVTSVINQQAPDGYIYTWDAGAWGTRHLAATSGDAFLELVPNPFATKPQEPLP